MSNRHPSSRAEPPEKPGEYLVQGFPRDDWRRLHWSGDGFYARGFSFKQLWWKWKDVNADD
jgi:hypothetical protein